MAQNFPALIAVISKNADLDIKNNDGMTALHFAIWQGYLHLAAPLLKAGANPNIEDNVSLIFI